MRSDMRLRFRGGTVTFSSRNLYDSLHDTSRAWLIERSTMSVITVKRTVTKRTPYRRSLVLRSFRGLTRTYFASEKSLEFAVEALLFAIIAAISAWPIFAAADALNQFLRRTAS
jgi:hypothetical protein